jgi:hypothetical protein
MDIHQGTLPMQLEGFLPTWYPTDTDTDKQTIIWIIAVQYPYCLCLRSDWLDEKYCTLKTSVQCTDCLTSMNFQMFL